jgi:hypothetical protein
MKVARIRFYPEGNDYEEDELPTISQGLTIIEVGSQYVVIFHTIDEDRAEIFDDFDEMIQTLKRYYTPEVSENVQQLFSDKSGE